MFSYLISVLAGWMLHTSGDTGSECTRHRQKKASRCTHHYSPKPLRRNERNTVGRKSSKRGIHKDDLNKVGNFKNEQIARGKEYDYRICGRKRDGCRRLKKRRKMVSVWVLVNNKKEVVVYVDRWTTKANNLICSLLCGVWARAQSEEIKNFPSWNCMRAS